jgi:hypothetical protein
MIISKSFIPILYLSSFICFLSVLFLPSHNEFGNFCRSLGVFTILLAKDAIFLPKIVPIFIRQFSAMFLFSRKPYPPNNMYDTPWRYEPIPGNKGEDEVVYEDAVDFSMTNTLLAIIFSSGIFGWNLAKLIPFFPSWLGALLASAILGYFTTFNDTVGDFLRFLGYYLVQSVNELYYIATEVQLIAKLRVILGQLFFFLNSFENQFHLLANLKRLIAAFIIRFSSILYRFVVFFVSLSFSRFFCFVSFLLE